LTLSLPGFAPTDHPPPDPSGLFLLHFSPPFL
jgi:hypothetical protein